MLKIQVELSESYNEETNEILTESVELEFEHSLVSLSKWESEFEKPYLDDAERTDEEVLGYIRAMLITPDVSSEVLEKLTNEDAERLSAYIGAKRSATWFNEPPGPQKKSREKITSELVYYWMVSYQIPWEAQYWHLNRLFTLIKVFNAKNSKPTKVDAKTAAQQRADLNAARKARLGTNG